MNKHIVIITGRGNSGKTMSICLYFWHLTANNTYKVLHVGKKQLPVNGNKSDFICVLEVKGIKVGFCSYGDPGEERTIENSLKLFTSYNCDLIIGARRTKGGTFRVYRNFCANNPQYAQTYIRPIYCPTSAMQMADNVRIATNIQNLTMTQYGFK